MVVFYHQQGAFVRCETQAAPDGCWELLIVTADGREMIERFADSAELQERQRQVEHDLLLAGWGGPHGRLI